MMTLKCKCGAETFFGSGMMPNPCEPCPRCGTNPGMVEVRPHEFEIHTVETDEGSKPLSRCRWCMRTKKAIAKLEAVRAEALSKLAPSL